MGRSRSRSRSRERRRGGGGGGGDSRYSSSSRDDDRYRPRSRSRSRSRGRRDDWDRDRGRDRRRDSEREREREREKDRDGRPPRHADEGRDRRKEEGRDKDRNRDRDRPSVPSPRGEEEMGGGDRSSSGSRDKPKAPPQAVATSAQEEDDDEPLDLDEASMALLLGGGQTAEEEERLIEERKRKREEIEALHRAKGGASGGGAGVGGGVKRPRDEAEPVEAKAKGHESEESEEESEEEEGPVEVRVHHKPLREEEELTLQSSGAGAGAGAGNGIGNGNGNEGDEAIRNGQRERDEEPEFLLDMFALDASKPAAAALLGASAAGGAAAKSSSGRDAMADSLEDNWDDPEGYYKTLVGEVIAGRYLVLGSIGRGVFSSVLKCQDKEDDDKPVAIKVIRNNEVMRKAAHRELDLLREISAADPDNKKHCVRLLDSFEHRNHVVLVFESLQMNLRETLRKFGKHVGINIAAVRTYAKQLFVALKHIGQLQVVHADIKPDNILVSDGFAQLKLCDFGSAFKENAPDNDPTPYLVSRFYRAPEIIFGFEYDRAVDLWSIGCCLFELFTGRVTFPGANNNEMLRLMMELKGAPPQKVIRRHRAAYERLQLEPLFEADGRFRQLEMDPVTKKAVTRLVHVSKPTRELQAILMKAKAASDDRIMVQHLADLLEKIFTLDPAKRISVREALHHPFVSASAAAALS